jgi:hypothetical protein
MMRIMTIDWEILVTSFVAVHSLCTFMYRVCESLCSICRVWKRWMRSDKCETAARKHQDERDNLVEWLLPTTLPMLLDLYNELSNSTAK